jgi:hypothetical protein
VIRRWAITTLQRLARVSKLATAKNIAKGPTSAAYWANKAFWSGPRVAARKVST